MKQTALGLLVLGVSARYAWKAAPEWAQADAWNAHMVVFTMALLGLFAVTYRRSWQVVSVCIYLAVLYAFTAGCSILWLISPWPVLPGQDQCDAAFRLPLALMGLFLGLVVLFAIRSRRHGQDPEL